MQPLLSQFQAVFTRMRPALRVLALGGGVLAVASVGLVLSGWTPFALEVPVYLSEILLLLALGQVLWKYRTADHATQRPWQWLALAQGVSLLTHLVAQGWPLGEWPVFLLAGAYYLFSMMGLASLAALPAAEPTRWRPLMDTLATLAAAGLCLWLVHWAQVAPFTAAWWLYGFAYPLGDFGLLFVMLVTWLRFAPRPTLLWWLGVGVLVQVLTGLVFGYQTQPGNGLVWRNLGSVVSHGFFILASVWQTVAPLVPQRQPPAAFSTPGRWRYPFYVPYLLVAVVLGLLLWGSSHLPATYFEVLSAWVGGITALVLLRQLLSLNENRQLLRAEQHHREIDALLLDFSRRLLVAIDAATMFEHALDTLQAAVPGDLYLVTLVEPETEGVLRWHASAGRLADQLELTVVPPGDQASLAAHTLMLDQPILINRYSSAEAFRLPPRLATLGLRAGLAAPMRAQAQALGVLEIYSQTPQAFQPEHRDQLSLIASQMAAALERLRVFQLAQQQLAELSVLRAVAVAGTEAADEEALIRRVVDLISDAVPQARNVGVLLLAANNQLTMHPASRGATSFTTPLGQGITGQVALTGQPRRVEDVRQAPEYIVSDPEMRAELCVPLRVGDRTLGVLDLEHEETAAFSVADERLMMTLAQQFALALDKLRLLAAEKRRVAALTGLHAIGLDLTAQTDLAQLLTSIVRRAALMLEAAYGSLYLWLPEKQRLVNMVNYEMGAQLTNTTLHLGEGLTGRVAASGEPILIDDYQAWNARLAVLDGVPLRAVIGVPIYWHGNLLGVFNLGDKRPHRFNLSDLELVGLFSDQAAVAIANSQLYAETQRRLREQTLLYETSQEFSQAHDLHTALTHGAERIVRWLGADGLGYYLYDDAQTMLLLERAYWAPAAPAGIAGAPAVPAPQLPPQWALAELPTLTAALGMRIPRTVHVADEGLTPAEQALIQQMAAPTLLLLPMAVQDQVIGGILVWDQRSDRLYADPDQRLLIAFATQAAVAIQNARLFVNEQQRAAELEAIRQAGLALTASLDLAFVLKTILQSTMRLLPEVHEAFVFLYDAELTSLTFGASLNRQGVSSEVWTPRPQGLTHTVARTGLLRVITNMPADPLFAEMSDDWAQAIVGLPLKIGERVVGVMNVVYAEARTFPEWELRVLRLLGDQAAITIENARLFAGERVARAQAEALREVAATLNTSLDRESLLNLLLGQLARVVRYDSASVMLLSATNQLAVVAADGFQNDAQRQLRITLDTHSHLYEVLHTRRPLIIADTQQDQRWHTFEPAPYIRCWLGVPLVAQGRTIGLLNLDKKQPGFYTTRDAELVAAFANQAAVALENARLFDAERRQLRLSQTLQAVGALLTAQMSLTDVFEQIFRLLAQVVHYDSVSVQLVDENARMYLAAGRGFKDWKLAQENVLRLSEKRPAQTWLENRLLVIPDTLTDARWIEAPGGEDIRSWIGAALVVKGDLVGILTTDNAKPQAYDAATGETVRAFANQAAVAIVNARLFDDLQRQTRALTSLYNTALTIGSELAQDALFRKLYEQIQQLLNPDTFVLLLYRPESDTLAVAFAIENGKLLEDVVPLEPLPISEGLTGWIVRHRQPLLVNDILNDPMPVTPRHDTLDTRAWLGVPLIVRDRIVGAMSVQSFRPGAFKAADLRFMESIATQAAIALENARLYAEVSARLDELSRLYAATQDLSATLEPRAVLQKLATHLTEAMQATSGYVLELDWATRQMIVRAEYWSPAALAEEQVSDMDVAFALADFPTIEQALLTQTVLAFHAEEATLSPAEIAQYQTYGVQSSLVVPLVVRGQAVGFAEVWESRRRRDYTLAERRLAQTLCQQAANALENARLFAETARHAEEVTTATTILHSLNATSDMGQAFNRIVPHLRAITHCERVSIALLDPQNKKFTMWAIDRPRAELAQGVQLPTSATAAAPNVLAGMVHLTPDLATEAHYPAEQLLAEAGYGSRANLPLRVGERVIGSLNLVWQQRNGYAQANLALLGQIAEAIALAFEKSRLFEETRRRDVLLEALAYAGEQLLLPGELPDILPNVLKHLGEAAQASRVYIFEKYEADGLVLSRQFTAWAAPSQSAHNMPYLVLSGLDRWAGTLQLGRPLSGLTRDFPEEERQLLERYAILSVVVVPIFLGERVWGFLGFDDTTNERVWSAAEVEALKSAAGALGAALLRQQSESAEREQRALAEALRDTAAALNSTLDQDEVLDRILTDVGRVVQHNAANILLIEDGQARVVRNRGTQHHDAAERPLMLRFPVSEVRNLVEILRTGEPVIVADTHAYPGWVPLPATEWIRSNVGAPIRIKDKTIGFIILDSATPDFFSQAHAERLQAFANQAGLAIEHAQLYQAVLRHADELEQRVAERTRELAEANVRLRELDRLKDGFISTVSHELRTPLTNIKLHLGLVDRRGAEALPRHLPIVLREADRLHRLIEDLLDLSRLQVDGFKLLREPVLLDGLLDEIISTHLARAEARGQSIVHDRLPIDLRVPVDRAKMIQVFTNLIGNAVAYAPANTKITIALVGGNTSAQVGLQFHNEGNPIPPEDLAHLFDRFYRGRTGQDSGEPGTGLGLAICREIVERHGGRIDVTSNVEEGTTFTVWLPTQL